MAIAHGIRLKKKHGQHFLKDQKVVDTMLSQVSLTPQSWVLEIGCGDGFLTRSILQTAVGHLWVFEIDPEWALYVQQKYPDPRMTIFQENILDISWDRLRKQSSSWTVLSNLPYNITFPILHLFQKNRDILSEGVVMVQEEVAQKITKQEGRGYGFISLYFQHYFDWKLLTKVPAGAFFPPPKVDSRLVYFKPRQNIEVIPEEEKFWKFVKLCFLSPRRTLRNNLRSTQFNLTALPEDMLNLRAQQLVKQDFLALWKLLCRDCN